MVIKHILFAISFILLFVSGEASACSMCKITKGDRTFVGNNEDAWGLNPKIWFEASRGNTLGVAYVGHKNNFPQGGMNEAGLVYDGFTLYPKEKLNALGMKSIPDISQFVRYIMQKCRTVEDVEKVAKQYNRTPINGAMFLFVDAHGNYMIMEADTLIMGNEPNFVLVNFRPSEITNPEEVKISRYHKGLNLLNRTSDTSLGFCASVMDTMKACRRELGDGTLYTSVYDLNKKVIRIYFYHNYASFFDFDLNRELSKGNHAIYFEDIFDKNREYEKLKNYYTPINNNILKYFLGIISFITIIFTLFFSFKLLKFFFSKELKTVKNTDAISFALSIISNCLIILLLPVLFFREAVYYFGIKGSIASYPFPWVEYYPITITTLFIIILIIHISNKYKYNITNVKTLNIILTTIYIAFYAYWHLIIY
jgi:hypothetical protein